MSAYIVDFFHESHFSNKTTKNIYFFVESSITALSCALFFSFLLSFISNCHTKKHQQHKLWLNKIIPRKNNKSFHCILNKHGD